MAHAIIIMAIILTMDELLLFLITLMYLDRLIDIFYYYRRFLSSK